MSKPGRKRTKSDNNYDLENSEMDPVEPIEIAAHSKAKSFDENVAEIKAFVSMFGELPKSRGIRSNGDERRYWTFLYTQNSSKLKGKLSDAQIELLESIPTFKWSLGRQSSFHASVDEVKSFVNTYNELPKYTGSRPREKKLAEFMHTQRRGKKDGRLEPETIEEMESIPGFEWRSAKRTAFEESVEKVKLFVETYQTMPKQLGPKDSYDEKRLFSFLNYQRVKHKEGKLSEEKTRLLETIPDWKWEGKETHKTFEESVNDIKNFIAEYNEFPKSSGKRNNGQEQRLATFVFDQRKLRKAGRLSEERAAQLSAIEGFEWAGPRGGSRSNAGARGAKRPRKGDGTDVEDAEDDRGEDLLVAMAHQAPLPGSVWNELGAEVLLPKKKRGRPEGLP